jgi:hypothetical protein
MTKSTALTIPNLGMPADLTALAKFAAGTGDDDVGDPLQLNGKTGAITSGNQGFEHKPGELFAFLLGEAKGGYLRFENGKPVASGFLRLADPETDLDELRKSFGDYDPDKWKDTLPSGLPKDPFNESVKIPCVGMTDGKLYTFRTNSWYGVNAARRFMKACIVQQRAAPETTNNHVPVAAMYISEKMVSVGRIFYPRFEVDDWVPIGAVMHLLGKTGNSGAFGVIKQAAINEDLGEEPSEPEPAKPAPAKPAHKPRARF